jgi:hypothetical protein
MALVAQDDKKDDKKDEDKIGKSKAPEIMKKASTEIGKKKGYHAAETISMSGAPQGAPGGGDYSGVVKKDFMAFKGTLEIYGKGSSYLVHSGGSYVPPEELKGQEAGQAAACKNPAVLLNELTRIAGSASYSNDADVDGHACKVLDLVADEAMVKEQLKELGKRIGSNLKQYGITDVSGYLDPKKSTSLYKVYVGKNDLLVYKIEWSLKPHIKEGSVPGNVPIPNMDNIEAKTEVTISKYDEELDITIPKEIQTKFGVK